MRRNDADIAHFGGGGTLSARRTTGPSKSVAGKRRCFW
jgi:hypothetical protein